MASPDDASLSDLMRQLTEQSTRLAQQEIELAKVELSAKGKKAGIGAGAFGGAAIVGLLGLGALVAAAILLLATAVSDWLAALIVAVVLFAIAGVAALIGKGKVEEAGPPVPERTVATVKEDVKVVKERAAAGRAHGGNA